MNLGLLVQHFCWSNNAEIQLISKMIFLIHLSPSYSFPAGWFLLTRIFFSSCCSCCSSTRSSFHFISDTITSYHSFPQSFSSFKEYVIGWCYFLHNQVGGFILSNPLTCCVRLTRGPFLIPAFPTSFSSHLVVCLLHKILLLLLWMLMLLLLLLLFDWGSLGSWRLVGLLT